MVLVRMLRGISGYRDGEPWPAVGETIDLPEWEAEHMFHAGHVAIVEEGYEAGPGTHGDAEAIEDGGEAAAGDGGPEASGDDVDDQAADGSAAEDGVGTVSHPQIRPTRKRRT